MSTARPVSDCEPPVCLSPYTEMGWAGSFCGGPTHSPFLFSVLSVFTYRAQFPLPWLLAADCSYGAQLQGLHNNEQGLWPGVECKDWCVCVEGGSLHVSWARLQTRAVIAGGSRARVPTAWTATRGACGNSVCPSCSGTELSHLLLPVRELSDHATHLYGGATS